jgi:hypothetical protein
MLPPMDATSLAAVEVGSQAYLEVPGALIAA